MNPTAKTILVAGATGQQGGATARHLLADGWRVRALVRNPVGPAAQELARMGAELVRGDMDDRSSLDVAVRGAYGVFSVQPALIPPDFAENELQRGLNVAEAAGEAGVEHLVYASVASADRNTGIPHWDVKWQVEQRIRALGVPSTMLRPVMFMENHADPTYGLTGEHALIRAIPSDATVQLIALSDIGAFAALAFGNPEQYLGKAIELAGDELTLDQMISAIARATGRTLPLPPSHEEPATRTAVAGEAEGKFSFCGWQADIPALRAQYPALMDFDTWLARDGKAMIEALLDCAEIR
ncbi:MULTISPECIES: NmrA/HSCARG family protein [Streptomyces]|uniref:NmrA/HSCARG family protein n=1 Tax=Streptomyces dengpaensis TaxID=2049881 RepID=A0ABN5I499_9ACTN|nr:MULTISPECIES: NmrA/HSCARG family protein [Streptomyces]AVH57830.1 NmrA/HSCARG family protein [Streptomyces dengpaensis]PIB04872.1 NmrA family protein [Streptomyces sp. HG99]